MVKDQTPMQFKLDQIVPWGRSFQEYQAMFALSESDLQKNILGCGDGPSSFNVHLTRQGGSIISIDPLYQFSDSEIRDRIRDTYPLVLEQTRNNFHQFNWTEHKSVENLGRVRMAAMDEFLSDYPRGHREGRYCQGSLPSLSFKEDSFQLALCSHLLFLYSNHFSFDFHVASIKELCRVSSETRIFPLVNLNSHKSAHLEMVLLRLEEDGLEFRLETVPYEFQKGGNEMLRIFSK